jgi:hypothetical protein
MADAKAKPGFDVELQSGAVESAQAEQAAAEERKAAAAAHDAELRFKEQHGGKTEAEVKEAEAEAAKSAKKA